MKDPLTIALETLEAFIINSPAVAALVKPRNIDGGTTNRGGKLPDVSGESDRPSIELIPRASQTNTNHSSNSCLFDLTFEVVIMTGDQRYTVQLFPTLFAVFAACTAIVDDEEFSATSWQDYHFIKNVSMASIDSGKPAPGIKGAVSVCQLTLHMILPRGSVIAWHNQT